VPAEKEAKTSLILKGVIPVAGLMLALVPSLPESSLVALREYGTKSFREVIEPALDFADGAAIDEQRANAVYLSRDFFKLWPTSMKQLHAGGACDAPGEIFHQPDLAATIRGMIDAESKALKAGGDRKAGIDAVRDYFYRGAIAKKIDEFSRAMAACCVTTILPRSGSRPKSPSRPNFMAPAFIKPGFWSQGPAMIETLNMLNGNRSFGMRPNTRVHPYAREAFKARICRPRHVTRRSEDRCRSACSASRSWPALAPETGFINAGAMKFGRDGLFGRDPERGKIVVTQQAAIGAAELIDLLRDRAAIEVVANSVLFPPCDRRRP